MEAPRPRPHRLTPAARLAVAGTGFARALAELMIFGYLPIQLHSAGEERVLVLALITAIPALVRFVSAGWWGARASRSGRLKPYLLLGMGGYLGVLLVLPVLPSTLGSVLAVGLGSLIFSAVGPLSKSYVSLLGREGLGRSLAGWLQAESLGWLVGGLVISLAGEAAGAFRPLLLSAAVIVGGEALLIGKTLPEVQLKETSEPGPAPWAGRPRLTGLLRRPQVAIPLAAFALLTLASEGTFTVYGVYLTGALHGSEALYGASITVSTLLGVLAYRLLGQLSHRIRPEGLLPAAATVYTASYLVMAGWKEPWAAAGIFALPIYALARVGVTWQVARETSERERSAAMGFLDGSEALAEVSGSLAAGAVADGYGFAAVFVAFSAASGLVAFLSAGLNRAKGRQAAAGPGPDRDGAPSGPVPPPEAAPAPERRGSPVR